MAKPKQQLLAKGELTVEELQAQAEAAGLVLVSPENLHKLVEGDDDEEGESLDIKARIEGLLSQDSEAFIKVYRWKGPGQKMSFCTQMQVSEFDEEEVRRLWGPGSYKVRVISPKTGRTLAGPVITLEALPAELQPRPAPGAPVPAQASGEIGQLALSMSQMMERMTQTIVSAMGERSRVYEELRVAKELFGGNVQPGAAVAGTGAEVATQMMNFFLRGLEIAKGGAAGAALAGTGEPATDNDVMIEAIRHLVPMISKVLGAQLETPGAIIGAPAKLPDVSARPPVKASVTPIKTVAPASAPVPASAPADDGPGLIALGTILVKQAAANADPYDWIPAMISLAPKDDMKNLLLNPQWFEELVKILPAAQPHREWFDDLRSMVLHALDHPDTWPQDLNQPEAASGGLDEAELP